MTVLVVGFVVLGGKNNGNSDLKNTENETKEFNPSPTLDIIAPSAYKIGDGGEFVELQDGSSLEVPITIKVSDGGRAAVYFADGSVARIDSGSEFTIREGSYDKESGTAKASIFLSVGRVWSKVMELATPDSLWEVETSNAVATVRGTAFDTKTDGADTKFSGSENNVDIVPIDPKSRNRIRERVTELGADTNIEIKKVALENIIKGSQTIKPVVRLAESEDRWMSLNRGEDKVANEVVNKLKSELGDAADKKIPVELKIKIREKLKERSKEYFEEHKIEILESLRQNLQSATGTKTLVSTSTLLVPSSTIIKSTTTLPVLKPTGLNLLADGALASGQITEGARIPIKAVLKMSDGSSRDITEKVVWQILGKIGSMEGAVFVAKLDPSVAEYGESSGSVIAVFKDVASGAEFLGKTAIFKVLASGNETPLDIGGQ